VTATALEDRACEACLVRSWLLARLAAHLERVRARISQVLALDDPSLIAAVAGRRRDELRAQLTALDPRELRARAAAAGLELVCRCDPSYPRRLRALCSPPAVLHVAGGLQRFLASVAEDPVAIVGARRATPYGLEVARSLGRGLAGAGVTVVSGMALGVDAAAHAGALAVDGRTVAVLPAGAERTYPPAKRALHAKIRAGGAAVSELPPGSDVHRWTFPARNRIIAALSAITIVVEAGDRSGALLTARFARGLGRPIGAVPGRVTSPLSAGPNGLLAGGATVVRGPQDVLDALFGAGVRDAPDALRPRPAPALAPLLDAIAEGHDTSAALSRAGFAPADALAALAALELGGYVRREPGGRFSILP
jgi:DNA processing protein